MITLIIVLLVIIAVIVVVPNKVYDSYDEYCNLECWSRRKPCCYR